MENNSTPLTKKLKSYSALAGTLVTAGAANAQIMYTDVMPDVTVGVAGSYNLDLDNNAVVDFMLTVAHYTSGAYVFDYAACINSVAGNASDTVSGLTVNHALNDPLNATSLWNNVASYGLLGLNLTSPFPYPIGNFLGATDRYVGLKFDIGGATHYGWVRIDLNSTATSLVVKSYGYKNPANTQSLAGEMPTGLNENSLESTSIFASDNTINVKLVNHESTDGFITVTNVLGNVVAKVSITNETTQINLNNSTSGIYFTTVTKADGSAFTKKLFVK